MSQFQATKCDECGRIQGEANHWVKIQVWINKQPCLQKYAGVAIGDVVGNCMGTGDYTMATAVIHDLCGQGCAVKHIASLLKWNLPASEPTEER
jgi:outer membrane lipoprotein SlyB